MSEKVDAIEERKKESMQKNEKGWYRPEKKEVIRDDYLRNRDYFREALGINGFQIFFCSVCGISCVVMGELMMLFISCCYSIFNGAILYRAYCESQKVKEYNFYIRTVFLVSYQHGYNGNSRLGAMMDGEEKRFSCFPRQLDGLQKNTFITIVTLDYTKECPEVYILDNVYMEYMENEEWETEKVEKQC